MTVSSPPTVYPVVLSGGSGTRLWPMSRAAHPKQLLPLLSDRSMLQETVERVRDGAFAPPMVVCNDEYRFVVAHQLQELKLTKPSIVLEPTSRNTAASVAVAALLVAREDPDGVALVLPSDHDIPDAAVFRDHVQKGLAAAQSGKIVVFGVRPTYPATGYGYICPGDPLGARADVFVVDRFVEKPDAARAQVLANDGLHLWNSGMFLFRAGSMLEEFERLEPDLVAGARRAVANGRPDLDFFRLEAASFGELKSISLDRCIMERTQIAAVVRATFAWNDVGTWDALWQLEAKDADGNVLNGDVVAEGTKNSYLRSTGPLVAAFGIEDTIVVATDDAVLVADRRRAQDVTRIVERIRAEGRVEHQSHVTVHRPWGTYETIDVGERFQVKHIRVDPGQRLSLQLHHHRAEHWVVVQGTAKVRRGDETIIVHENESTYIPVGQTHSLENPGKIPLRIIEIQSGAYLGEDDIVRLDDSYGRIQR